MDTRIYVMLSCSMGYINSGIHIFAGLVKINEEPGFSKKIYR